MYDTSTGQLLHTLLNPAPGFEDNFGYSLAVDGTRVVVGTPHDSTRITSAGIVYIYDLASASPTQPVIMLNTPDPTDYACFGISVAIGLPTAFDQRHRIATKLFVILPLHSFRFRFVHARSQVAPPLPTRSTESGQAQVSPQIPQCALSLRLARALC